MDKVANKIYDELIDMSNIEISSHALTQYNIKCFPKLSIIDIVVQMRKKLASLKKIEINNFEKKLKNHPNSEYYIDEDDVIYVVVNDKVITTYPNERIFVAKPMFSNKKTGNKWM